MPPLPPPRRKGKKNKECAAAGKMPAAALIMQTHLIMQTDKTRRPEKAFSGRRTFCYCFSACSTLSGACS